MPRFHLRLILLTACLGLVVPAAAHAEISVVDSVGWIAADSDLIVRGTITDVRSKKQGRAVLDTVTVKVAEVLKGKDTKTVVFDMSHSGVGDTPTIWKTEGGEMLLFLQNRAGKFALRTGNFGWLDSVVRLNDKPQHGVFTTDFQQHTKSKDVLDVTRTAIDHLAKEGKPKSHLIGAPFDTDVFAKHWNGSGVIFVVPVNQELEAAAETWVKPDKGDLTNVSLRQEGLRALAHFKSEKNVKLLKTLLSDTSGTLTEGEGRNTRRIFVIRKDAYNILKSWKIEVERPILEEAVK